MDTPTVRALIEALSPFAELLEDPESFVGDRGMFQVEVSDILRARFAIARATEGAMMKTIPSAKFYR